MEYNKEKHRNQIADLVLLCPETQQDMFVMSELTIKNDDTYCFMVSTVDKTTFYNIEIKIKESIVQPVSE